jgi:hypothetical protein
LIENAAKRINGVTTVVSVPPIANHTPLLNISWDIRSVKISRNDLQDKLRKGNPSIEVMGGKDNSINITVFMLKSGQEKIVTARLLEELKKVSG